MYAKLQVSMSCSFKNAVISMPVINCLYITKVNVANVNNKTNRMNILLLIEYISKHKVNNTITLVA